MIIGVLAKNFRSIGPGGVDIPLSPLTVLLGPNGSGKSNILRAVLMCAQHSEAELRHGGSLIFQPERPLLPQEGAEEQWHKLKLDEEMTLGLTMALDDLSLPPSARESLASAFPGGRSIRWTVATWHAGDLRLFGHEIAIGTERLAMVRAVRVGEQNWQVQAELRDHDPLDPARGDRMRLDAWAPGNFEVVGPKDDRPPEMAVLAATVARAHLLALAGHVFYLSNARGILPPSGRTEGTPTDVGPHGEHVIEMLSLLASKAQHAAQLEQIRHWCGRFGMLDVTAGFGGANRLVGHYRDPELACALPLHLASFGSSQVLALIVQVHAAAPGDTILVEEPETSLHPDAQLVLAELLAHAVSQRKVQVILSTHSETSLLGLQAPLQGGLIKEPDVAVYEVGKAAGGTYARPLDLVAKGRIAGPIPSFDSAAKRLYDLMAAAEEGPPPVASRPAPPAEKKGRRKPRRGAK